MEKETNLERSKMNKINEFYKKSKDIEKFTKDYINYLNEVLVNIDTKIIKKLEKHLENCRKNSQTIFVIGNGGSSTTATTMSNDLGFDILKKTQTNKPFRFVSLADNNAVITAIANDVGYENIFINQLKIHFRKGDSLLVISASGNSENLLNTAKWIKKNKGKLIGFLGFNGGKLKKYCDICVQAKTNNGEYGPVEDTHLILNHILAHWFQNKLN